VPVVVQDDARVEHPGRVEQRLDLAHHLVQFVAVLGWSPAGEHLRSRRNGPCGRATAWHGSPDRTSTPRAPTTASHPAPSRRRP
jgi:hypothetical protein